MKLYLYNKNDLSHFMTVYGEVMGDRAVILDEGGMMSLPEFIEASSKADFSEKLFEQQSIIAPDIDTRVAALEEMMATIIYGGEIYAQ